MALLAKIAMVLSWTYYTVTLGYVWIGQLFGLHNEIWDVYGFPIQDVVPPLWTLLVGFAVSLLAILSLGMSYRGGWRILNGGPTQDFRDLGENLRRMAWGLIGFWISYNLLSGAVQHLIVIGLPTTSGFDFGWDPLDFDIVFAITGVVLLAISQTLERAWVAEDETKHFL